MPFKWCNVGNISKRRRSTSKNIINLYHCRYFAWLVHAKTIYIMFWKVITIRSAWMWHGEMIMLYWSRQNKLTLIVCALNRQENYKVDNFPKPTNCNGTNHFDTDRCKKKIHFICVDCLFKFKMVHKIMHNAIKKSCENSVVRSKWIFCTSHKQNTSHLFCSLQGNRYLPSILLWNHYEFNFAYETAIERPRSNIGKGIL